MERIFDSVTAAVEEISPARARAYKDTMPRNRTLRERDVRRYMEDMSTCASCGGKMAQDGQWECGDCGSPQSRWALNGEPWVFDWFGRLIEGEHRAEAILRSGATIATMVVRGVDPAARSSMNDGVKRIFADDLVMAGQPGASQSAGLMRKIACWQQAASRNSGHGGLTALPRFTISRSALGQLWPANEKDVTKALHVQWKWAGDWPGNQGALLFMAWLLDHEQMNPEVADRYFSIIAKGSQDPADSALLRCRGKLIPDNITRRMRENMEYGIPYEVFWMIRGWNGWLKGERNTSFALPKGGLADPYPKLQRAR